MTFERLKRAYQEEIEKIKGFLGAFPWEDKEAYANWCAQTYYYVCHSTRLLALSATRIPLANDAMYQRYIKHIGEEANHEKLAFSDLKKMGGSLKEYPELAVTAAFYQTQYYYIEHVNPYALFGYILLLEGMSADYGKKCYERAKGAHGSEKANFWRVHAEEDPGHIDQAFNYIQKLAEADFEVIARNLRETGERYGQLLEAAASAGRRGQKHGRAA